jgi:hypothetical protein
MRAVSAAIALMCKSFSVLFAKKERLALLALRCFKVPMPQLAR